MGVTGPDKGKGGKYLVVPPGYAGDIPEGYFLLKPPTNRNFMFLRGLIENGLEPAVENIISNLKVYPLKDAANPATTEFVDMSNKAFNTVFPSDFSYFENLNEVIQEEPIEAISPEVRGVIAAIGIVKGKPFAPDARMKTLLTKAATLGAAASRAITYQPRIAGVRIIPTIPRASGPPPSPTRTPASRPLTMGLYTRVLYHFNAGGVPRLWSPRDPRRFGLHLGIALCQRQAFTALRPTSCTYPRRTGKGLLCRDALRHPDAVDAANRSAVPYRHSQRPHRPSRRSAHWPPARSP